MEAMAESLTPLGIQGVASMTKLDKATSMRMLKTLCGAGYVTQDPNTKTYTVTDKLHRLAAGATGHQELRDLSRPYIVGLRDSFEETVHLGVLRGAKVIYIDKLESQRSIRLVSSVGQEMPLHSTALGKAILSSLPEAERKDLLRRISFERRTARTITKSALLQRDLVIAKSRGWAADKEENEENAICIGAAIVSSKNIVLGAISVSGPSFRMSSRVAEIAKAVRKAASNIAATLDDRS